MHEHTMPHTRVDRIAIPDDPEEIRALFQRRMRERDKVHNPHKTPDKDMLPEENRATEVPRSVPNKQATRKFKPYRVILLTKEETRAIDEGRLTTDEIKNRDTSRDDGIPKPQRIAEPKPRQATCAEASSEQVHRAEPDQTSTRAGENRETDRIHTSPCVNTGRDQETGLGDAQARAGGDKTSTGKVHETGPDVGPARAGEVGETERVHEKGQASPRHDTSTELSSEQVHRPGPDRKSKRAGEDNKTDRAHTSPDENMGQGQAGETEWVHEKGRTWSRQVTSAETSSEQDHTAGPDRTTRRAGEDNETDRVHTRPDENTARVQAGETERVHEETQPSAGQDTDTEMSPEQVHRAGPDWTSMGTAEDNESVRVYASPDTKRTRSTGHDQTARRSEPGKTERWDRSTGRTREPEETSKRPGTTTVSTRNRQGTRRQDQTAGRREPVRSARVSGPTESAGQRANKTLHAPTKRDQTGPRRRQQKTRRRKHGT